jgi:hypothetical protein
MSKSAKIELKARVRGEFSESKLAELLGGLTKEEYKKFGLFIRSPYFNKSKTLEKLYEYFKRRLEKLDDAKITKENISKHIYPGEKFDDANVRKQVSNFAKMVEEFLVQAESEKDKQWRKNILLGMMNKRNLDKSFNHTARELENIYSSAADKDTSYYLNYLNTQRTLFDQQASRLKAPEENIKELTKALDMHYLSLKLLHYYDILNLRMHYNKNVEFDMWAFDEIVRFIERNNKEIKTKHSSIYSDYLSVIMLLNPTDGKYYNDLKQYVMENKRGLGRQGIDRFYVYLYNHSIYRLNRGFVESNNELFDIIKIIDSEDVPIWNYFAFHIFYINAVTNAARVGDFEWADGFIKRRRDKIQAEIRNETHNLAMANLYFTKRDYDNALRYIVNVDYPNYSYYLMSKDMLVKIYWERSEPEGVISTIEAMRKFLQRKELIPQRLYESYTNFINCVSKMVDANSKDKTYEIKKLLEKEMIAADKHWVIDKMNLAENQTNIE